MPSTDGSDGDDGDPVGNVPSVDADDRSVDDDPASRDEPATEGSSVTGASTGAGRASRLEGFPVGHDRVLQALVGIVLLGLVVRLLLLGDRTAHFDEGRVAYIHGPLLQHADRWLFGLIGANDFVMRLPLAIVGALLPLSALLFRRHLRSVEVVAVGAFLGFNPVLLYYSRFMRSDVLVAAFMFVAIGFVVRYYDTRRARYLYLASGSAALGFGAKENAVVYVLVWVGATALLADQALYRPRAYDTGAALLRDKGRALGDRFRGERARLYDAAVSVVGNAFWIVLVFVVLSVFIYAPRGAGMEGLRYPPVPLSEGSVGLWQAVGNPLLLPDLVAATADHTVTEFLEWFGSASDPGCNKDNVIDGWLCYLGRYVEVLFTKAAPLAVFAIGGFLYERYGRARTRTLVMYMTYAGAVSVVGYPLGTDVWGAWLTVHALVPLSIPAAVGVSVIAYWGYDAFVADDSVGAVIAAAMLVMLALLSGTVILGSVYLNDQSEHNNLVQFAQPGEGVKPTLEAMGTVSDRTDGTHLLIYHGVQDEYDSNRAFVQQRESQFERSGYAFYPLCTEFHNTLPLPWYIAKEDVETECERDRGDLVERLNDEPPPVVITQGLDDTVPRAVLEEEYVERTYPWRTYTRDTSFWFHEDHADALPDQ